MVRRLWRVVARGLPSAVTAALVLAVVVTAVVASGFPRRQLDLNDTGIWISNDADGEYGRINKAVGALDARLTPPGQRVANFQLDILQDGALALGWDQTNATATMIDTALGKPKSNAEIGVEPESSLMVGGGTIARLDRSGRVWATRYDPLVGEANLATLDSATKPLAELGLPADAPRGAAALAVAIDGTVTVAGNNGRRITIPVHGDTFAAPVVAEGSATSGAIAITTVGTRVVVLDSTTGHLTLPHGTQVAVEGASWRLQQPGPQADWVLVATSTALLRVGLDTGLITPVDTGGNGEPASPVRLGGCDFAAWAGPGRVSRACDNTHLEVQQVDRGAGLLRPVFRVNHSQLLLNDQANGRAWDLDEQRSVDNWPDLRPQANQQKQTEKQASPADAKPHAVDDQLLARPGRTTVLHLLDNDMDTAGGILAISSITTAELPKGTRAQISPDGQAVLFSLPSGASVARFGYVVSNGVATDEGAVTVTDAGTRQTAPHLRPRYQPVTYASPSFGTVSIPVTSQWRDDEGDPVTVLSASAEDGSPIPVTSDGVITFTAGEEPAEVVRAVSYRVTDGDRRGEAAGKVSVRVLAAHKSTRTVAAVAEPDIARGEVGKPIAITPLANDRPGADPRDLSARLRLNSEVSGKANLTVTTDVRSGQVLAVATRAGSYLLSYTVAYGNAPVATGRIRVDVAAASGAGRPVAMPDQVGIRGQSPVLVDVLANDYDPGGGLLTVQDADPAQPTQVQVQVVAGRWLRILPTATLFPNPQAVHYTVTNGEQEASGDVLLTQLPEVAQDAVLARKDSAVVRAGDSVLIPVLANDSSLGGQALSLATDGQAGGADGQLRVVDPSRSATEDQGDVGRAYIRGSQVRYVPPATVPDVRQVVISYTAQTVSGDTAESQAVVTINPEPSVDAPNQAPNAGNVEMRVVSGSRVTIMIPTCGQDPDGDTVTVASIASAPTLGRVVAMTPQSITYEAYPTDGLVGTDTFGYTVVDKYGQSGSGSIRVAVTEPGQTQAPVAIDDVITAAPGAEVEAHVLANDLLAPDDAVSITDLAETNKPLPNGVALSSPTGPITALAPGAFDQPTVVNYSLVGNGGTGPGATLRILAKEGFNNPPVVADQVAQVSGDRATANLLDRAWDPDGPPAQLTPEVLSTVPGATLIGGQLTVPVLDQPQTIAFQVSDAKGAVSAAVVYVPAGVGPPRLTSGGRIEIPSDSARTISVADYVESPRTQVVRIVGTRPQASPVANLAVQTVDATRLTLTSSHGYVGPGSVTVEVMDSQSQTDDGVLRSLVTIPVQVGAPTPVLRCPNVPQVVVQGGEVRKLDITTLCHVWSADPGELPSLHYAAQWVTAVDGVQVGADGSQVRLQADGSATGGSQGSFTVSIPGTQAKSATINVAVVAAPPAQLRAQRIADIKAGVPVSLSIAMDSPLLDPQIAVLEVEKLAGGAATATHDDASVTITPDQRTSGEVTYRIRATDLASDPGRKDRWVEGTITVVVYAVPDPPGRPRNGPVVQSHAATLSWQPGKANGAAIDGYQVRIASGPGAGRTFECRSTPCQLNGLENGRAMTFTVQAHNKAGLSRPSPASVPITPNTAPGSPAWVKVSDPQDKSVLVSWGPISNDGSALTTVHVTVNGVTYDAAGTARSLRVATPSNNLPYTFTVAGENSYDIGTAVSTRGQSSGKPIGLVVGAPQPRDSVGAATAVKVAWSLASAEGPAPVTFAVTRSDGTSICRGTTAFSCTDDKVTFDGTIYTYEVTATNGTGGAAHSVRASSPKWAATGTPDDWQSWTATPTGTDGTVSLNYTVPKSRGASSTVTLLKDDAPFRSMPASTPSGGAASTTIDRLSNGGSYSLSLRVCNEAGHCTTSGTHTVTPYGPLATPDFSTSASGDSVTVSATGNGSGASAKLVVKIGGTRCESGSSSGSLSRQCSAQIGWDTTVNVTVQVVDTSPYSRATKEKIGSAKTGPRPAEPKVLVRMGAQETRVDQYYNCSSSKCHWVVVELQDFSSSATCRITDSDLFGAWGGSWTQNNGVLTTDKLYGGNWIVVTCGGVSSGRVPWG